MFPKSVVPNPEARRWKGAVNPVSACMVGFNDSVTAAIEVTVVMRNLTRAGSRVVQTEEITAVAIHRSSVDFDDDDESSREEQEEVEFPDEAPELGEIEECSGPTVCADRSDAGDGVRLLR